MKMALTPEQLAWMQRQQSRQPEVKAAVKTQAQAAPVVVLTEAEIDWLWPRFQRCRHQVFSFAHSFAKTARARLTPKGKACLPEVAFKYRRQIFPASANWTLADFIEAIRRAAQQEGGSRD